jgi:hypothetical protein
MLLVSMAAVLSLAFSWQLFVLGLCLAGALCGTGTHQPTTTSETPEAVFKGMKSRIINPRLDQRKQLCPDFLLVWIL